VQYSEADFYLYQQEADQRWWLACFLAVCVHALVVLLVMFTPSLFEHKPVVEEVVSVSLVAMPDAGGAPAPPPAAAQAPSKPAVEKPQQLSPPPPPPPPPEPKAPSEPVPPPEPPVPAPQEKIAVKPEPVPEPVETKSPISLAPEKRKIKKAKDTRLEEEKIKEREQEQRKQGERDLQKKIEEKKREAEQRKREERELQKKIEERRREAERQKAITQARLDQIRAENEARAAAAEARKLAAEANAAAAAASAIRADADRRSQAMQSAVSGGSTGRQQAQSIVEQTYWQAVADKVKSKWVLPEMRRWDASLVAKVVITIRKNGEVTSIQFDQRSKDPLFDQLVEKTIKNAAPMPPFPILMQQESTEVGFKFLPGELGKM